MTTDILNPSEFVHEGSLAGLIGDVVDTTVVEAINANGMTIGGGDLDVTGDGIFSGSLTAASLIIGAVGSISTNGDLDIDGDLNAVGSISTDANLEADGIQIGFSQIIVTEIAAPPAGSANVAKLFVVDSGAGKTILKVQMPSGAAIVLATEV